MVQPQRDQKDAEHSISSYSSLSHNRIMDITKVSKRIYEIAQETASEFGRELTPELMFMHISEEVGEIARQLVNKNLPMREYSEDNLKEEIAQTILDLLALSEIIGMDLQKEINQKLTSLAEKRHNHNKCQHKSY